MERGDLPCTHMAHNKLGNLAFTDFAELQSAAEEEARLAGMSADERKKHKQKQKKVWALNVQQQHLPA